MGNSPEFPMEPHLPESIFLWVRWYFNILEPWSHILQGKPSARLLQCSPAWTTNLETWRWLVDCFSDLNDDLDRRIIYNCRNFQAPSRVQNLRSSTHGEFRPSCELWSPEHDLLRPEVGSPRVWPSASRKPWAPWLHRFQYSNGIPMGWIDVGMNMSWPQISWTSLDVWVSHLFQNGSMGSIHRSVGPFVGPSPLSDPTETLPIPKIGCIQKISPWFPISVFICIGCNDGWLVSIFDLNPPWFWVNLPFWLSSGPTTGTAKECQMLQWALPCAPGDVEIDSEIELQYSSNAWFLGTQ